MFTGIIEEVGNIIIKKAGNSSYSLFIECRDILTDIKIGDSISVDGTCLTANKVTNNGFFADVMPETVSKTTLSGKLKGISQKRVNLERALTFTSRLGGHLVSGHIDGTGKIQKITRSENAILYNIEVPSEIAKYIVMKGSIAIDGISLTIASIENNIIEISIIPHTASNTTLIDRHAGELVNIECDIIGRYIEKLILNKKEETKKGSSISYEFLSEKGFL